MKLCSPEGSYAQPIKKALTLCNVALLGAASGIDTMIQLSLRLISVLVGTGWRTCASSLPSADVNMQIKANAAPTETSLPVPQATRILGSCFANAERRSSCGRCVRSWRLPFLPVVQGRWMSMTPALARASRCASSIDGAQHTIASKPLARSRVALSPIHRDPVGSINVAGRPFAPDLCASSSSPAITAGRSSSFVASKTSLFAQNDAALSPQPQAS